MDRVRSQWVIIILSVVVLFLPRTARAQERLFAGGLGAVTFGPVTASDFAARVGVKPSSHVALFGEFGRMTDVLPSAEQQTITDNTTALAAAQGGTTSLVLGHVPAGYGEFGVRAVGKSQQHVKPFGEAAFGFTHLTSSLTATIDGADVTSQVLTTPLTSHLPQTAPLMSLSGGLSIAAGKRTSFDIGYRYSRVFADTDGINVGKLYGAVHVGF